MIAYKVVQTVQNVVSEQTTIETIYRVSALAYYIPICTIMYDFRIISPFLKCDIGKYRHHAMLHPYQHH